MNYTKTVFSFFVALAVIVMAPTAAFALTTGSAGTGAGTLSTESTGTSASTQTSTSLSTGSVGTSAGTTPSPAPTATPVATPSTGSVGNSAGNLTGSVGTSAGNTGGLSTGSVGSSAGNTTGPSTGSVGTSAGNTGGLSTGSVGSSAGNTTGPSTGSVGTSAGTENTNTGNGSGPVGGVSNKGNTVSSSSSSGGGSYVVGYPGCAFSTGYIKIGTVGAEVTKLQNFLKSQGFNVTVTGAYDVQTVEAVKNFQSKYSSEVLAPWGINYPTGYVYITTSKKINQISCSTPLFLTPAELAIINATKAAVQRGEMIESEVIGTNTKVDSGTKIVVGTTTTKTDIASNNGTTSETQVATASKSGVFSKIWKFIKRIFGRN